MDAWKRLRASGPLSQPFLTATLAVYLLLTLWLSWITLCGTSALATMTWCLAVAVGAGLATLVLRWVRSAGMRAGGAAAAAVAVVLLAPAAIEFCLTLGASNGLPWPGVWLLAASPALLGSVVVAVLLNVPAESAPGRRLAGIVSGAALFMIHAWLSLPFLVTAAVLSLLIAAAMWSMAPAAGRLAFAGRRLNHRQRLLNVAAGAGLVAGGMVLNRVFTVSPVGIAVAVVLTALVLLCSLWPVLQFSRRPWIVWCCCLGLLTVLPWGYSSALTWNLQFRAAATTGFSIVLFHGLQLAAWSVPLLLAMVSGSSVLGESRRPGDGIGVATVFFGAASAWGLCVCGIPAVWLAAGSLTVIAVVPALLLWQVPAVSPRFVSLRVAGSFAAVLPLASLLLCSPDPAAPSQLLFSMRSLAAVQRGVEVDMIPETDATRLVDQRETADGTFTTWKTQANRFEFRLNGLQVGEVSTDTSTTPQQPAEVLTCILPLVLHPQAGSVLLLDDFSGVALNVCEQFPLHRVVAVESRDTTAAEALIGRPQDDRFEYLLVPSEIAIRDSSIESVDVVISALADPSAPASLSRLSTAWYQAASARLNEDGVFCQRFRQRAADRETIAGLLGRVSAVFEQVAVVQLVPGELAVVATHSPTPLLDKGVLKRMERRHVRRQLGRCGWDWCQLAALSIVDSADPVGLWNHESLPQPSGLAGGAPGLRLGWQTIRPGNQALTVYQMLAPHQRRIAEAVPRGPGHEEFRRRISAYAQQLEILTAFPDEPWVYRKSLKSEMQRNQRKPVEVMKDGELHRTIHPLDQHRKDYVTTLGGLLKQIPTGKLSAADLERLKSFSVDYEPLISDFAHYELVRIHELARHPSPVDEFQHRLHTVHYSQPGEYSVRNVVGALQQLTRQSDLVSDDEERFDLLNSLVQELIVRWESRTHFEPRSAVRMQRDVELSIQTVQRALIQMEQLSEVVGVTRGEFLMRRRFVSEALIGPLRDYEKHVLAHRASTEPLLMGDSQSRDDIADGDSLRMLIEQPATN